MPGQALYSVVVTTVLSVEFSAEPFSAAAQRKLHIKETILAMLDLHIPQSVLRSVCQLVPSLGVDKSNAG